MAGEHFSLRDDDPARPAATMQALIDRLRDKREKRALAVRAALRCLHSVPQITSGPWRFGGNDGRAIILHTVRLVFVGWASLVYSGIDERVVAEAYEVLRRHLDDFDAAMPNYYEQNIMGSDAACGISEQHTRIGRGAVALAEAIETFGFIASSDNRTSVLDTSRWSGYDERFIVAMWRDAQLDSFRQDHSCLSRRRSFISSLRTDRVAPMMMSPLWCSRKYSALETNVYTNDIRMHGDEANLWRSPGHSIDNWAKERKEGALVLGRAMHLSADRIVSLANQPRSFWEDAPAIEIYDRFDSALTRRHGEQ